MVWEGKNVARHIRRISAYKWLFYDCIYFFLWLNSLLVIPRLSSHTLFFLSFFFFFLSTHTVHSVFSFLCHTFFYFQCLYTVVTKVVVFLLVSLSLNNSHSRSLLVSLFIDSLQIFFFFVRTFQWVSSSLFLLSTNPRFVDCSARWATVLPLYSSLASFWDFLRLTPQLLFYLLLTSMFRAGHLFPTSPFSSWTWKSCGVVVKWPCGCLLGSWWQCHQMVALDSSSAFVVCWQCSQMVALDSSTTVWCVLTVSPDGGSGLVHMFVVWWRGVGLMSPTTLTITHSPRCSAV